MTCIRNISVFHFTLLSSEPCTQAILKRNACCLTVAISWSKTTDECGDNWRRLHRTGNEYIRVGIVQETSTYECLEVWGRVHMSTYQNLKAGDQYLPVGRAHRLIDQYRKYKYAKIQTAPQNIMTKTYLLV